VVDNIINRYLFSSHCNVLFLWFTIVNRPGNYEDDVDDSAEENDAATQAQEAADKKTFLFQLIFGSKLLVTCL